MAYLASEQPAPVNVGNGKPIYPTQLASSEENGEEQRVSLGLVLLDKIWNGTVGTLSIDVKRQHHPTETRPMYNIFTVSRPQGAQRGRGRGRNYQQRPSPGQEPYREYTPFAFEAIGARIKAMRHIQFGAKYDLTKHGRTRSVPTFDLGFGGSFELDTAEFHPSMRLKFRDFLSLKLMPRPTFKLQKRLELGTSGYAVKVSYECPLEDVDHFWQPPARLLVTLDNTVDTGVRITQSGLEFAANKWLLNDNVRVRALGVLSLPSELPVEEGDQWLRAEVKRLGIKAGW